MSRAGDAFGALTPGRARGRRVESGRLAWERLDGSVGGRQGPAMATAAMTAPIAAMRLPAQASGWTRPTQSAVRLLGDRTRAPFGDALPELLLELGRHRRHERSHVIAQLAPRIRTRALAGPVQRGLELGQPALLETHVGAHVVARPGRGRSSCDLLSVDLQAVLAQPRERAVQTGTGV